MAERGTVEFDSVWKKFARGEQHDSLRDLLPAMAARLLGRRKAESELGGNEFWALKDVSFRVAQGQSLGIIGHNGAGKSTALKLLTRILRPTRGHTSVTGRVGALIEVAAGFHPDLTGRENVFLQGAIMGMTQADIAARFDEIVAFSGVETFIDTQLKRYSSGMNARLGFAVAAHLEPEVLLIDEVLAVGDSMFQARCLERIRTLKQSGVALVFVSHNLPAVESLCDRVLWLDHGSAMFLGEPRTAVNQYLARSAPTPTGATGYIPGHQLPLGFESIRLLDADGHAISSVTSGGAVTLHFVLASQTAERRAMVGFALHAADGHCVFGENNTVAMPPFQISPGQRLEGTVSFSSLTLPEGRYHFTLAAECPASSEVFDRVDRAVTFDVAVAQEANRIGSLRFSTNWTVRARATEDEDIVAR